MARVKGIFFTVDGLLAALIVVLSIVVISRFFISEPETSSMNYLSQDLVASLSQVRVNELDDPYIKSLIAKGNISHPNNTIIEQIGEFYVLNQTELAINLSRIVSERLVPGRFGFEILVNGETVIRNESGSNRSEDLVSYRRLISGIEKLKPLRGATSKVYLEGINEKTYSSYLYYGGFIGQGNITQKITDIPEDADITSIELELDVAGDFNVTINDESCSGRLHPVTNITLSERWNLTDCKDMIKKGEVNIIDLIFNSTLNTSYVSGGFMRVDYKTQQLSVDHGNTIRYNFPGIGGVVNLYDAFYVPGTLNKMHIYLHFKANETSYLTIGGRIIHSWNGSNTDQVYNITDADLHSLNYANVADDYPKFSNNTVPIRFASYESVTQVVTGGNADVILITDFSGSMKKAINSWTEGTGKTDCEELYGYGDARKTHLARCVDNELVATVLNYSGNRLWPVFLHSNTIEYLDYPWTNIDYKDYTMNYISAYGPQGKDQTCLACAINRGYDILKQYSNASRKKFVILMTDGVPNYCPADGCNSGNSTAYFGTQTCNGFCDTNGMSGCGGTADGCADGNCANGETSTIYAVSRLKNITNATFYTIGFGLVEECSKAASLLTLVANMTNGTYQHSSNVSGLRLIYQNISYEILNKIDQAAQVASIKGNITSSTLYPDSFIETEYVPIAEQPAFDEIAIAIEEPKFSSCNPTFDIPEGMRVTDAKVISYSGPHWTDSVTINNKEIYNISKYLLSYVRLGDPFFVYIPVNNIVNGTNTLLITTGDSPENRTGCSLNNTIIYTGLVKSSVAYNQILPITEGCTWNIEFDDGGTAVISVPPEYAGANVCYYTQARHSPSDHNQNDSYDAAAYELFKGLDYDKDGRLFVNIVEYNLVVSAISVQQIPYPWGPAIAEVRVWR